MEFKTKIILYIRNKTLSYLLHSQYYTLNEFYILCSLSGFKINYVRNLLKKYCT